MIKITIRPRIILYRKTIAFKSEKVTRKEYFEDLTDNKFVDW